MALYHAYNQTVGDGTATSVVRPSDWNSGHNQFVTLSGNTAGASTISGTNIVYQGGNNVTLSAITAAGAATIVVSGANTVAQTVQPVAFSASGGSSNFSTLAFSNNGNNVTFINSGGQVALSHSLQPLSNTSAITAAAFPSANTTQFAGTGTTLALTNLSGTINVGSNGVALSLQGESGGGGGYTGLTYNNRQLGASGTTSGQNSVWLAPMRLANAVSVSTLLQMVSIAGASSSNTGSVGITYRLALYQNTATSNASRMDQIWSTSMGITGYMSSSNSAAFTFNGGASGQVTSIASANSNVLSQISGVREITFLLNTVFDAGLYAFGYVISTSSVGNSAAIRSFGPVIDNPMALGMGAGFGGATNNSIGYVDAGTYSVTSNNMPTSFLLQDIRQTQNVVPYVKMGAI